MRIRTLLNRFEWCKSFVYKKEYIEVKKGEESLIVDVVQRKNGKPVCSGCGYCHAAYDYQSVRDFEFVPLWGMAVYFRYRMRRVDCPLCGVKVEQVPWSQGKSPVCTSYALFLAGWAKSLSWQEVADTFKTSWHSIYNSVRYVVEYGLAHRQLDNIEAVGIDELQYGKGRQYMTLVYQLDNDNKRLLFMEKKRTVKSLLKYFRQLGKDNCNKIKYVCTDMWKPYLKVIRTKMPQALNILDRFHIVKKLNEAVDEVRRKEASQMKKDGFEPVLANTRYCFLKKAENLTDKQNLKLDDVLKHDLKTVKAYLHKVSFQAFWQYNSPYWAEWFLKKWCNKIMLSQLEPMKKLAKTLRNHQPLLMNWFKAKKAYSSGSVEGLNRKINLVTRKSYGFRNFEILKIALLHTMGNLPEPNSTHCFLR